jgi:hypothetical protein
VSFIVPANSEQESFGFAQDKSEVGRQKTEDRRQNEESSIEFVPFRGYIFSVFSVANFRNDKMKRAPPYVEPVGFFGILL